MSSAFINRPSRDAVRRWPPSARALTALRFWFMENRGAARLTCWLPCARRRAGGGARSRARVAGEGDGSGSFQKAIFVSAPLRASARMIWRHLRDCLVGDLLRRSGYGGAPLRLLPLGLLSKYALISGDGPLWLAQRRQEARRDDLPCRELEELFDR